MSHSIPLRMRNVSDKIVEKIKTHILCAIAFFFENRVVCEIMWKTAAERDRLQITIWCMRVACWVTKVTDTHSDYIILFVFPLLKWLNGSASVLRYTYIDCLFSLFCETEFQTHRKQQKTETKVGTGNSNS